MTKRGADEFQHSTESGGFYQLPVSAEDICGGSAGGRRENGGHCLSGPAGRGLMAGMEAVLAAQEGMMAGWTWMLEPVFCFFFSPFSYWDIVPIYPVQRSLCW